MEIKRDFYLKRLIHRMNNGMVKVVTGIRRCGKTYLLFNLFYEYLLSTGIADDHIIKIPLDDIQNEELLDSHALYGFIRSKITDTERYYVLLDEVQLVEGFETVLNSLLHIANVDTYVTGSNAKFLSKDIITEFRGRGDQIHISSLSFAEFMSVYDGDKYNGLREYMDYGALPLITTMKDHEQKAQYLSTVLEETYLKDIIGRYNVKGKAELGEVLDILASSVGSLTNPTKLCNTFRSVKGVLLSANSIASYIEYMEDAFIISRASRYDIKGKRYIDSPFKYYFSDIGLRNARLNFRQIEDSHIMENIIYNEIVMRGFSVDVGVVPSYAKDEDGSRSKKNLEVDFVCNMASKRYYIQSALAIPDKDKMEQEFRSLAGINDSFKKIVVVRDFVSQHYNDNGILIMNIYDFLLNSDSLSF